MNASGRSILEMAISQALEGGPGFSKASFCLISASLAVALIGLVFLAVAFFGWLLTYFSFPVAALVTASTLAFFSFLGIAIAIMVGRSKARSRESSGANLVNSIIDLAYGMETELEEPVRENPKTAVLLAALSGFILAERGLKP